MHIIHGTQHFPNIPVGICVQPLFQCLANAGVQRQNGLNSYTGLKLNFIESTVISGIGNGHKQAVASLYQGHHLMLAKQLVVNQVFGDMVAVVMLQGVDRYAKFHSRRVGNGLI